MYGSIDKPIKNKKSVKFSENNEIRYYDIEQKITDFNNVDELETTTLLLQDKNNIKQKKLRYIFKIGAIIVISIISLLLIFYLCL